LLKYQIQKNVRYKKNDASKQNHAGLGIEVGNSLSGPSINFQTERL